MSAYHDPVTGGHCNVATQSGQSGGRENGFWKDGRQEKCGPIRGWGPPPVAWCFISYSGLCTIQPRVCNIICKRVIGQRNNRVSENENKSPDFLK